MYIVLSDKDVVISYSSHRKPTQYLQSLPKDENDWRTKVLRLNFNNCDISEPHCIQSLILP